LPNLIFLKKNARSRQALVALMAGKLGSVTHVVGETLISPTV
jgi:hypothetical protein